MFFKKPPIIKNFPSSSNASNGLGQKKKQVSILDLGATICSVQAALVGPTSSYVQGCVEMGDENTRFKNPTKAIGPVGLGCFQGMMDIKPSFFKKRLSERFDSDESERNPIKSQHPWRRSWIFILGWYSPIGLRYHKLHLVRLGSSCETGGSRCKRKCWRSLSWLWWVEAVPQPLFWLHPVVVVLLLVVVVGRYLDWTTNPYFGAVSWI